MAVIKKYIKDIIYGANDGIITTFAVVAGVAGAELAAVVVVIVGLANLFADGLSMAASNYLGSRSEHDAMQASGGERVERHNPVKSAIITLLAFVIAGFIPLIPYLILRDYNKNFLLSIFLAGFALFFIGGFRTMVTKKRFLRAAFEMLIVGGLASTVAYFIGMMLRGLVA